MAGLIAELLRRVPVITDGAWGTELQALGLPPGEPPDVWNLLNPNRVVAVAKAYVEAGSDVILTNTFGANRIRLGQHGLGHKVEEINCRGVELSRRAANDRAKVFASMGPTGRLLLDGSITADELRDVFAEQATAIASAGADAIVVETMSDLEEAKAAVAAAKSTGLPVVACVVFESGAEKDRTIMGVTPEQAAAELSAAGADVVGANCGTGIEAYVRVCRRLRSVTTKPIWMKPNAGLPKILNGRVVYHTKPDQFVGFARALVEAGASFIGGCCGTNPDFIRALRRLFPRSE
ncbi:MAG: homocysteine S-methyltransferase family protein [Verrucomicrobiae bacterium]|nr:homocysteine S-methyltransferase family protein [Verrucomicrobiae bacterium]